MSPEQAPVKRRFLDDKDRRLAEQHEQLMRDDPAYAARWRAGLREMADRIDAEIAAKVYADLQP